MLSPVKLRIFLIFLGVMIPFSVKGRTCSQEQDLSWVKKLNVQVESYSKVAIKEAELIVQNALESASNAKTCSQSKELAQFGEEEIRQTLKSPLLMGDINSNLKELSDSRVDDPRVTETGVNETGIDDTRIDDTLPYPKLLVFVSFSMPPEALKILNAQVRQLGGKLVLRGLVNGSFQETAQKLKELQIDIIIDPTLFEAYQIAQIPTFILRSASTESAEEGVTFDLMTGNVSLNYVLEQFSTSGETQNEALQMLKALRRKL